jgi:UDP-N-acetylglucosamine 2-epimerase (non-hydrolysing)
MFNDADISKDRGGFIAGHQQVDGCRDTMKIIHVVGARPNFMKIAPIMAEIGRYPHTFKQILVHTGQHYDEELSQVFFNELNIPRPDAYLGVGSGSHADQTAKVMLAFEPVLLHEQPDLVLVVGDVNSTLACTLVAKKLGVAVAHVEAGLRSFDHTMPEEINRVLTDQMASLLFTTERSAKDNLIREGVTDEKIHFVGNVMIDTLLKHKDRAMALDVLARFDVEPKKFALLTLHRPANVDKPGVLAGLLDGLAEIQQRIPILFPAHPRTIKQVRQYGFEESLAAMSNLRLTEPLSYLEFFNFMANARMVLTDSGGIQEETTILGVPCLTLRENTERPATVTEGTNIVVGADPQRIIEECSLILRNGGKRGNIPELWDGHAARRIVDILVEMVEEE